MRRSIALQFAYIRIGFISALQYRVNFIGGIIGLFLHSVLAAVGGIVLIDRFGGVLGWDLGQVMFMFGLTRIQSGIIYSAFRGIVSWEFHVREGWVDLYLVRPRGMLSQASGAYFDVAGLGPIIAGIGLIVYGAILSPPDLTWWLVPWLLVVMVSGTMIQLGLVMIISSSAFYNVKMGSATNAVERSQWQMNLFPASAYSTVVQALITIGLPWAFMAFYPAHLLYDVSPSGLFGEPVMYLAPVAAIATFAVAYAGWRRGIRSYQGIGGG